MPIRVKCAGCQSILEVKDTLAGSQGCCPKCGGVIQVPASGAAGSTARLLADASELEMVEELNRRKKSAVLVEFETPESESYELHRLPGANLRCYRTADMNDAQLMQVLQGLGHMSQGKGTAKEGVGLGAEDGPEPFELKGDRLGISLSEFKAKYARKLGAGMSAPFCSDSFPGQALQALHAEPWHTAAGIIHARVDLPTESSSPTVAGVDTELLLYQFIDEKLFRITALFDTDSFHHIREGLFEKHGTPTTELADPLGFIWRNEVSTIELVRGTIRPKRPSMLHLVHSDLYEIFQSRVPTRSQDL